MKVTHCKAGGMNFNKRILLPSLDLKSLKRANMRLGRSEPSANARRFNPATTAMMAQQVALEVDGNKSPSI